MIYVREELCLGCGLCIQICPQGALYFLWGQVQIDQNKCNSCGLCLEMCPQGAITEKIAISSRALMEEIKNMREQTEVILARISRLSSVNSEH